jgi:hypothetical protein
MAEILDPLILDLVEWCARERRSYAEVIDAWRTSCPRLTVWEDAIDRGLLARKSEGERGTFIDVTTKGREFLRNYAAKELPAASERCENRAGAAAVH